MTHKLTVKGLDFELEQCTLSISKETESGYPAEET